jgi:plastocyanin
MRLVSWTIVVIALAVLAAGCGGGQGARTPAPQAAPPASGPGPATASGPAAAPGAIVVVGKDNFYEPATLALKAGQSYEILFKNEGTTVHNLIVQAKDSAGQDFASDIVVNGGGESRIKVKIDRAGTYKIVCTYHPEMVGEVKVEP